MIRICRNCQKEFSNKGKRSYCDECNLVTFNCRTCGKEKTVPRHKYNRPDVKENAGKYCSTKCAIYAGSQLAAKQRVNGTLTKCPNCGNENYRSIANAARVFCNSRCYGDYRAKNPDIYPSQFINPEVVEKAIRNRESRGHNGMKGKFAENHHRWTGGKIGYRGPSWQDARKAVIFIDGENCAVCGNPGKNIHHIVPFRKFKYKAGENRNDILANNTKILITLCYRCHATSENNDNKNIPLGRVEKAYSYFESLPHPK